MLYREPERIKLKPIREELIATGKRTDKNLADGVVGENAAEPASEPTPKPEATPEPKPDSRSYDVSQAAAEIIPKDAALDIEAMLSERGIKPVDFLNKIKAPGVHQILVADHPRAIRTIEELDIIR